MSDDTRRRAFGSLGTQHTTSTKIHEGNRPPRAARHHKTGCGPSKREANSSLCSWWALLGFVFSPSGRWSEHGSHNTPLTTGAFGAWHKGAQSSPSLTKAPKAPSCRRPVVPARSATVTSVSVGARGARPS